ncbi:uncharacterized protein LOC122723175 isoform X2 [Manihot esculenta]|nr:uncharacterized protein LOC122723175 isoform X2 [Manihot esculenta]
MWGGSSGMEMYTVSGLGNAENYLIQSDINHLFTSPPLEQVEAMYNEGAPDFFVDQGLYYPTITNYGYYCTELESPGEWEDCHRIFGADGPEIHYAGVQTESSPCVNYTLSNGRAQSVYNPYSPCIPGAMIALMANMHKHNRNFIKKRPT